MTGEHADTLAYGPLHGESAPGRHAKFDRLVANRRDGLFRFACWLIGDRDLADDIVQETLMRAWRAIDTLQRPAAAKGWLLTILRREHARHLARPRVQPSHIPPDALASPHPGLDTSTEACVLRSALDTLPAALREPLLMQVLGGYSLQEIAREHGITAAGAGTRVFRARSRLRDLLGERASCRPH